MNEVVPKIFITVILILCGSIMQSCSDGNITSVGSIEGVVTDAETGLPVKGITVTVDSVHDFTSDEGEYYISNIDVGSRNVNVSEDNFKTFIGTVNVQSNTTVVYNIVLTRGQDRNTPPVAEAGESQDVFPDSVVYLDGSDSYDPDDDSVSYKWGIESAPSGSYALLDNGSIETPSFTPDIKGIYVITLAVNDGLVDSAIDRVIITAKNRKPVADAGESGENGISVIAGTPVSLSGSGSSDADEDSLAYQWSVVSRPPSSHAGISNPTQAVCGFTPDTKGDYQISLIVNDGSEDSDAEIINLTALNRAPVADAGDAASIHVSNTVTLNGNGSSDGDGDALTYSWKITDKPAGSIATLSDKTAQNPELTPDVLGNYVVSLTVHDGYASSGADTVTITSTNVAPVADAGDAASVHGFVMVTLDGSGSSDGDGDALTYSWEITDRPAGSNATLPDTTARNPELTPDVLGNYMVSLTVHDGYSSSEADTVTITSANAQPVANAGKSGMFATSGTMVNLDGSNSHDADGDTLSYTWTLIEWPLGSTADISNPSTSNPFIEVDVEGTYRIQLLVNDGFEDSEAVFVMLNLESTSKVPDTGQTTCYDETGASIACPADGEDYYGQDATYQYTNSPSYTKLDSGGGDLPDSASTWAMVRDNVTGLVWEVKTDDGGIHDRDNTYTWQNAQDVFIAQLNADTFGGYTDWRMPTIQELAGIVDYGQLNPSINTEFFVRTRSSYYWTSTTHAANTGIAWLVYGHYDYDIYNTPKSSTYYVRAVRGEQ